MTNWPILRPDDLVKFRRVFCQAIHRFLPDYHVAVGPTPESSAVLSAPLTYLGRSLGYVSLRLAENAAQAPQAILDLWPEVALAALESVALKKALITDRFSGLNNIDYFMAKLRRLTLPSVAGPKALRLWDGAEAPGLALVLMEIGRDERSPFKRELKILIDIARKRLKPLSLARAAPRRLAALVALSPEEVKIRLENLWAGITAECPLWRYVCSAALYPQDLAFESSERYHQYNDAAGSLMDKAAVALEFAQSLRVPPPLICFGDLINSSGQIIQILPQDRMVVNLGATMGARPGQVFVVSGREGEPKGEITIFETTETLSLAFSNTGRSGERFSAGDKLTFSRLDWSREVSEGTDFEKKRDLERDSFLRHLMALAHKGQNLTLALVRLDDYDKLRALAGEEDTERRFEDAIGEALKNLSLAPEISVGWEAGTAAVVWLFEDENQEKVKPLASELVKALSLKAPSSMGLVSWPNPAVKPEGLIQASFKALMEASMTGSQSAIFFGPKALNISGDHLFDEGDLRGAMEDYRKGLLLDPGYLNLLNSLGVCHGRLDEHKEALAAFDEVLALDPQNLMAHFNKGFSLLKAGRLEEALSSLKKADDLDKGNYEVLFHLGRTALELGEVDLALDALNRASETKGRHGEIYRLIGRAKLVKGDGDGARNAFKKAVKFDPDDAESLSSLGVLFLEQSADQEVALSLFQRSVELDPTNSLYRQRLGKLLFSMGDYKGAEHHLKTALEYGCRTEEVRSQLQKLSEVFQDTDERSA
ncbi:MAG: tetratricopeptide repeat protein [Deltaproteobacteria bacterium]|jgi:tetratricopeptide (TPR) repeat protein|nr:tetratricopeptide repeat protein [Deltaproteobacteria bacterium]